MPRRVAAEPGPTPLSLAEYAVLGLVAGSGTHGFAVARVLAPAGEIGQMYSVARPAVYRAIERLIDTGLVRRMEAEPGQRGPQRTPLRLTATGQRRLDEWLERPVAHVREIRTEFLVKLALLERSGREPRDLVCAQIDVLTPVVSAIAAQQDEASWPDVPVALWRARSAEAALRFLHDLRDLRRGSAT